MHRVMVGLCIAAGVFVVHLATENYYYLYCKQNLFVRILFKDSLFCGSLHTVSNIIETMTLRFIDVRLNYIKESFQVFL
jgi:hypothetical protein